MSASSTLARWAALLAVASLSLAACASTPAASTPAAAEATAAPAAKLHVVTTMSILADMVRNVGGERVVAENIIPIGAGPEDYQATPQDAQKIAEADILFYNGFGLEDWLTPLFESAGKASMPHVAVSDGLTGIDADEEFAQGNPHFWMSAANGVAYVENIRKALVQADPAGEASYNANAAAYTAKLQALNDELKQQAAALPEAQRKLVTNHDAFPYFAKEYGFTVVGNILTNADAQPSAGELAKLIEEIKAQGVKAVFSESQFSTALSETMAKEAGAQVVANLYTDTLGQPGSDGGSYIDMLRYDMKTVVDALK